MTISRLSEIKDVKEYKVRRAINGKLDYTNFNSFLNKYRIEEACILISRKKHESLTIQEIAYEIGYQSIATFNRAFKKEKGMTPTEYMNDKKP